MMKFGVHEVKVDVAPPQMGIKLILEFRILLFAVSSFFVFSDFLTVNSASWGRV
jgi:hypothetical protein